MYFTLCCTQKYTPLFLDCSGKTVGAVCNSAIHAVFSFLFVATRDNLVTRHTVLDYYFLY